MNTLKNCIALLAVGLWGAPIAGTYGATSSGPTADLDTASAQFRSYVLVQTEGSLAAVRTMRERIAAHDLPGAQQSWLAARSGWESSEIVTSEYFPDLDRAIDAWPDGEKGFHAIEARLFGAHSTDVLAAADELLNNLTELQRQLRVTTLSAQRLLSGLARLTYEVGEDKAGGGESPFSGNSLAEIGDNVAAVAAAYQEVFAPAARRKQAGPSAHVSSDLNHLQKLVAVPHLSDVDQTALREASETLTADLVDLGQQLGLEKPSLGN
jgi:iron uptake system component EfeO